MTANNKHIKMEFLEIKENRKKDWDNFILAKKSDAFLQSFGWGKFQESVGRKVFYYAVLDDDDFLALALIVEHQIPFGIKYWYLPRGPVLISDTEKERREALDFLMENLVQEAKKERVVFLRMDPAEERGAENDFIKSGLRHIKGSVQPKDTLALDLKKSEEEILGEMKQKTRYNIRLAEKKGVEISSEELTEEGFESFWKLISETSERDNIVSHGRDYYYNLLKELQGELGALKSCLYFAKYQEKVVASNIVLFFGDYAIYLHGASSNEHRNVMAPYLLQWRQIQDAKSRGCAFYDFWGITVNDENPRWRGITKFKEGFGGRVVRYVGVYEKPINAFAYTLYAFFKKMRRH